MSIDFITYNFDFGVSTSFLNILKNGEVKPMFE